MLVETAEVDLKGDQGEVGETDAAPMVVVLVLVVQMLILVVVELTEVMLDMVEVVLVKRDQLHLATHLLEMVEME